MKEHEVILSAIRYKVKVSDQKLYFEEAAPIWGCRTNFTLAKQDDINDSPGIWYLQDIDFTYGRIPACHITKALKWAEENYRKSFEPFLEKQ